MSGRLPATGILKTMPGSRTVSLASGMTGSITDLAGAMLSLCPLVCNINGRIVCTNGCYRKSLMSLVSLLLCWSSNAEEGWRSTACRLGASRQTVEPRSSQQSLQSLLIQVALPTRLRTSRPLPLNIFDTESFGNPSERS